MNTQQQNGSIHGSLKLLLRQIRKTQVLRGSLIIATAILLGVLLMMAADYLFAPLPTVARWCMFAVWLVAVALAGSYAPVAVAVAKAESSKGRYDNANGRGEEVSIHKGWQGSSSEGKG